jgi:hypothetical protein
MLEGELGNMGRPAERIKQGTPARKDWKTYMKCWNATWERWEDQQKGLKSSRIGGKSSREI